MIQDLKKLTEGHVHKLFAKKMLMLTIMNGSSVDDKKKRISYPSLELWSVVGVNS